MSNPVDARLTRPEAFAALREIARSLSAAWDLDTNLDLIARKTTEVMRVDSCTIYLLDPDGLTLRLRATTGLARQALGRATLLVGEGMTGFAVAENRPVYAADARHDPHFKWVDDTEEVRFRSLLAVPLVLQERPIGALNVQTIEPHTYTDDEIAALSLIGDLAAGALTKAQLHDRQKRRLDELRTLAEVSEAVTSPQYLDDILSVVMSMAARTMEAALCAVYLLDEKSGSLYLHSGRQGDALALAPVIPLGQGVVGRAAETGAADYAQEELSLPSAAPQQPVGVNVLAMPLIVRDRAIGVLACYADQAHVFTGEQERLLSTLANQTALAIENARLVTNAAVVREMHHRIKNNLQTIAMLMQLQLPDADRLNTRQVLLSNIHRIRSIAAVHEILSEQSFRLVDVKAVLERIVQMTMTGISRPQQAIGIAVRGEAIQLPSRAATALAVVVNELVQNCLEHAFDGRPGGQIDISLGRAPDALIVLVHDDGVGLPDTVERSLGLEIAEALVVEDLHGRIQFNRLPTGTEVCIRLPRETERLGSMIR